MSYTSVYNIESNGDLRLVGDVKNAFRAALFVWRTLCVKYKLLFRGEEYKVLIDEEIQRKLWALWEHVDVSRRDLIVLLSTFDRTLCEGEYLSELVDCLENFHAEHQNGDSNLFEQAEIIKRLPPYSRGCGWRQNSVSSDLWSVSNESDEEEEEEDIPYNIDKMKNHFWIFETLKEIESEKVGGQSG